MANIYDILEKVSNQEIEKCIIQTAKITGATEKEVKEIFASDEFYLYYTKTMQQYFDSLPIEIIEQIATQDCSRFNKMIKVSKKFAQNVTENKEFYMQKFAERRTLNTVRDIPVIQLGFEHEWIDTYFRRENVIAHELTVCGKLNSIADEPSLIYELEDGGKVLQWHENDVLHRENGPAYVVKDSNGEVIEERWLTRGKLNRSNGPTIVRKESKGKLYELWFQYGVSYAPNDKPWFTEYINGIPTHRIWTDKKGRLHRGGDRPAIEVERESVGEIYALKEWYKHGKMRRQNPSKPSTIKFRGHTKRYGECHRDGQYSTGSFEQCFK